ncbi:hypothetical protein KIN20_004275 [Parelaphostrongylus tenuis]|uniref:Uncharacterized protein n=1 Tax=Parelaphostrongylus tenuis TaxID=148309 RepID=A0AAD5M0E3_PARTN|nr:hypothetical protein KIN20_004275 [Parelaphostrongylus tenuis]
MEDNNNVLTFSSVEYTFCHACIEDNHAIVAARYPIFAAGHKFSAISNSKSALIFASTNFLECPVEAVWWAYSEICEPQKRRFFQELLGQQLE